MTNQGQDPFAPNNPTLEQEFQDDDDINTKAQLENANAYFTRKAAEVITDADALRLLTGTLDPRTTIDTEELDTGRHGLALARLTAAGLCEVSARTIYITETGQRFVEFHRPKSEENPAAPGEYGPTPDPMEGLTQRLRDEGWTPPEGWPTRTRDRPETPIGVIKEITEDGATFEFNDLGRKLVVWRRSAVTVHRTFYNRHDNPTVPHPVEIWGRITEVGPREATFKIEKNGIHGQLPEGVAPLETRMSVLLAATFLQEYDWSQLEKSQC